MIPPFLLPLEPVPDAPAIDNVEVFADENDGQVKAINQHGVIQTFEGGGSQPITVTFPVDKDGGAGPTTITGVAIIGGADPMFYQASVFVGLDEFDNTWAAQGNIQTNGTFTDGLVLVAGRYLFNCASGTAEGLQLPAGFGVWQNGSGPSSQPEITGALSAVTDAAAKDVLTAIVSALSLYGLSLDSTT